MGCLEVLAPGAYTTVQDQGRFGWQRFGVPPSGSLDQFAARVANLLVGNQETAAVLEITFLGPRLKVLAEADVAVTGAKMSLRLNDEAAETWRSLRVRPGDVLHLGQARSGCRAYLALSGGVDVPLVMGSRSTYANGRLGGFEGRGLRKGDVLPRGRGRLLKKPLNLPPRFRPALSAPILLRAVPGPQDDLFQAGLKILGQAEFKVSPETDRAGCRLEGPPVVRDPGAPESIVSEANMPGGIQVPADGQPIIVLVEQTTSGYAKAATVVSIDLPRVAQAKPGDRVFFELIDLPAARALLIEHQSLIQEIRSHLASLRAEA